MSGFDPIASTGRELMTASISPSASSLLRESPERLISMSGCLSSGATVGLPCAPGFLVAPCTQRKPGAHGSPTVAPLLKQPDIEINRSGDSLSTLLAEGEVDAVISSRPVEAIGTNPDIARLFPNYREVEKDYYRRTRIFPIMHLIVIRRDVHESHPFVAQSLYDALCDSRDRALALMKERGALRYMLPWLPADMDEIDDVFGGDPWPYGVEANRPTLEALVQYMVEQHFIARRIPIEELFVVGR